MDNVFEYTDFKVNRLDFHSSVINRVAYNKHTGEMVVQFENGSQRVYSEVGPLTFSRFVEADSIGRHYNDVFKSNDAFSSLRADFDGYQKALDDDDEPLADWERELLEDAGPAINGETFIPDGPEWEVGQTVEEYDYDKLPVGSVVGTGDDRMEKISPTKWKDEASVYESSVLSYPRILTVIGTGDEPDEDAPRWVVGQIVDSNDFADLPVGSVLEDYAEQNDSMRLTKQDDNTWADAYNVYAGNTLSLPRKLLSLGDPGPTVYDLEDKDEPVTLTEAPGAAVWYNDEGPVFHGDDSFPTGPITMTSTNHLFDVEFRTGIHNGIIREGNIPVWAKDEAEALVKFQSAADALGYSSATVKSVKHYF